MLFAFSSVSIYVSIWGERREIKTAIFGNSSPAIALFFFFFFFLSIFSASISNFKMFLYLEEALGGDAAGLVVLFVVQALLLLAVRPAQGFEVPEALHGRGEHVVDGQRLLGRQAGVGHPQFHLPVSLRRPQGRPSG